MKNVTNAYAAIIKQEKQEDGTLLVYGKATDDSLDIDQQICDAAWLEKAMPEWFRTGGNIREQHSNIAAGVAKELNSTAEGHYISALVVDPVSVKKVETGVLKGFSIGIRAPRVVRDNKAANGRIIDGQIVEVSLVDRPANPNAKLMLAKCDNDQDLVKVEEYEEVIEKHGDHDQSDHNPSGGGGSDSKDPDSAERDRMEATRDNSIALNTETQVTQLSDKANNLRTQLEEDDDTEGAEAADRAIETLNNAAGALNNAGYMDTMSGHTGEMEDALRDLEVAQDILNEIDSDDAGDLADEVGEAIVEVETYLDELYGRGTEKSLTAKTTRQKERAMARTKKVTKSVHEEDKAAAEKPSKEDLMKQYKEAKKALDDISAMCKEAGIEIEIDGEEEEEVTEKQYGESAEEETSEGSKPEAAEEEVEEAEGKSAETSTDKCLECGCHAAGNDHGGGQTVLPDGTTANMTSAEMVAPAETPKSTIVPEKTIEEIGTVTDEDSSEDEDLSEKTITAIIEKAVKSAKDAVTNEIVSYKEEINKLQAELVAAKNKAVAGGPKRTAIKTDVAELSGYLAKAAEYRAKAAATSDTDLARGYRELAEDAESKAKAVQAK